MMVAMLLAATGRAMATADVYVLSPGTFNPPPAGAVTIDKSVITDIVSPGGAYTLNTDDFDGDGNGFVQFSGNGNLYFNNNSGGNGTFIIHAAEGIHTGEVGLLMQGADGVNYEFYAGSSQTASPLADSDIVLYDQPLASNGGHVIFDASDAIRVRDPILTSTGSVTLIARGAADDATLYIQSNDAYVDTTDGAGNAGTIFCQADAVSPNSAALADSQPRINADGIGGTLTFTRTTTGAISLGDGGAGLNFNTTLLPKIVAETFNVGNPDAAERNDTGITVNTVDMTTIGTTVFNPDANNTVSITGTSNFGNVSVSADETCNLSFTIDATSAGRINCNTFSTSSLVNLVLDVSGLTLNPGDTFVLVNYSELNGAFKNVDDGAYVTGGDYSFRIDYAEDLGGGDFGLTATVCSDATDSDMDGIPDGCDACPNRMTGDVNGDANVTLDDAAAFTAILLDPSSATAEDLCAADTNQDGSVNGKDIQSFIAVMLNP